MSIEEVISEIFDEKFEKVGKEGSYSTGFVSAEHFALCNLDSFCNGKMGSRIDACSVIEPLSAMFNHPNLVKPIEVKHTKFGIVRKYKKLYTCNKIFSALSSMANITTGKKTSFFIEFISHVLDGLEYMHRQGFIHSDIKPTNIMYDSEAKKFVIIDFNIMQFVGPTGFRNSESYGSRIYYDTSEQCGFLSDIRAFGKTLEVLYALVEGYESTLIELLIHMMIRPITTRIYIQDIRTIIKLSKTKSKFGVSDLYEINPKLHRNLKYYRRNYRNTVFTKFRKLAGNNGLKSAARQVIRCIIGFGSGSDDDKSLYVKNEDEYVEQQNNLYLKLAMLMWNYKS